MINSQNHIAMKLNIKQILCVLICLFLCYYLKAQEGCQPSFENVNEATGQSVRGYGDFVQKMSISQDDSKILLHLVQVDQGEQGTFLVATHQDKLSEEEYQAAVTGYLNNGNLNASSKLILKVRDQTFQFKPLEVTLTSRSDIFGTRETTVAFTAEVTRDQVAILQTNDLQYVAYYVGGRPFERRFRKPNKRTTALKTIFSCLPIESVFKYEAPVTNAADIDMTEVESSLWSEKLVGTWTFTEKGIAHVVECGAGSLTTSVQGKEIYSGTWKIAGDRIIFITTMGTGTGVVSMFAEDMVVIVDGQETQTWMRIK